jgi:spiro-SPASM protein
VKKLKSDILIYIDATSDDGLRFIDLFLPEYLAGKLRILDLAGNVYYSVPKEYHGALSSNPACMVRTGGDDVEFWKDLFIRTGSAHLCKISADSPFLDPSVIGEMIELHLKYLAEFTFSENLPAGFSCEVVSRELIDAIPEFKEKTLPLSQVVRSNINQFDIEIYYKDPDIRDKRISFLSGRVRDARIMERIWRLNNAAPIYEHVKYAIEDAPEVLYVGPSYLEIELSGKCDLDCLFCYRRTLKREHGDMDPELFKTVISQMKDFGLPYTVSFGGSGEPLMNPRFYEILAAAAEEPLIESVIVETNGIYADVNYRNVIMDAGPKIKTIFNMNGMNAETYTKLHGNNFFEKVSQNILALKEACPDRLYLQIMKIRETEPFLDSYYDYWEKHKVPVILQKQNTYLGRVQDRRYSDLSPIDRIPCWHLQRDLYILWDGTVCYCKQDVDGEVACGNIATGTLTRIWEAKKPGFLRDYRKEYPSNPDCKSCDEWYTFNF